MIGRGTAETGQAATQRPQRMHSVLLGCFQTGRSIGQTSRHLPQPTHAASCTRRW